MAPAVGPTGARRGRAARVVRLLLLLVPLVEVALVIGMVHLVGGWPTLLLLVGGSLVGAWLVRREGARAWRSLRTSLRSGGLPLHELSDAALVLAGGVLILVPGFLTDLVGLVLVLPPTRPLARRLVAGLAGRRLHRTAPVVPGTGPATGQGTGHDTPRRPGDPPDVVEGRVL